MSANLTFYIAEGILTGTVHGRMIHIDAKSGGGGGSRGNPQGNQDTNNPNSVDVKTTSTHRGGPLPPGSYRIATPSRNPHLGLSSALTPYDAEQSKHMFGRGGFFIHGRGPRGSDGCIVPMEKFAELMNGLSLDHGGMLHVYPRIGGDAPT
jgi:hypothetical protein